jgi:RHS repeat-associated protein
MTGSFPVACYPCCSASVWSDILTDSPFLVTAFWDRTRGLFDMRARSYDAGIGRFVNRDPLGVAGLDTNYYRYASNSPTGAIDPSGELEYVPGQPLQGYAAYNEPPPGQQVSQAVSNGSETVGVFSDVGEALSHGFQSIADAAQEFANTRALSNEIQANSEFAGALGEAFSQLGIVADSLKFAADLQQNGGQLDNETFKDLVNLSFDSAEILAPELYPELAFLKLLYNLLPDPSDDDDGGSSGGGGGGVSTAGSFDPNSMIGPKGYGSGIFVSGSALTLLPYQIDFENSPTATAPAQQVVITDMLDPNLDLSTLQLTEIAFGDTALTIPPGSQNYQTTVPMTYNGVPFDVVINASLNYQTRQLTVTFQSIDPSTQLPPSVLTGFLPPENATGRGEGYVSYLISPNPGLATGTQIRNVADIVFDGNTPIATDQVNDEDPSQGIDPTKEAPITIDNTVPTSTVAALPATESSTSFTVSWSGSDGDGSGIAYYNVYVSEDGGPFDPFQTNTTGTSATFTGQAGHTYSFISIATSNVGITQPTPSTAQATTEIITTAPPSQPAPPVLLPADDSGTKGDGITDDASPAFSGTTEANATVQLLNGTKVIGTATADAGGNYVVPVQSPLSPGAYAFTVIASNAGGSSPASEPLSLWIVAPPPTPAAPTLQGGGNTTTSPKPVLTGTTIPGATVQLFGASGPALNTAKANSTGNYTIQLLSPLIPGPHTYKVDITDKYGDVSSESPPLTITELVTVTNVVKSTNKKGQVTGVTITLSGPVNTAEADSIATYHLTTPGKGGSYTAINAGAIGLKSAVYNSSSYTVVLTPSKPFGLPKPVELVVYGTPPNGLKDTAGQYINGGKNAVAIISKAKVTIEAVSLAATDRQTSETAAAVDALLARDELAGLKKQRPHGKRWAPRPAQGNRQRVTS